MNGGIGNKIAVAAAVAVLLGLIAGCRPAGRTGRIDPDSIEVRIGAGGLREPARWSRVVVGARAAEGVFRGEVEISGRTAIGLPGEEKFSRPFEAAGVKQFVEVPFRGNDWRDLVVTFRGEDGRSVSARVELGLTVPASYRILGIGAGALDTGALPGAIDGWLKPGRDPQDFRGIQVERGMISPLELPRHFLGYDAADLVILHRSSLDGADPAALEALIEWVRRGGTLVGMPGPDWAGKLPAELLGLFGIASAPRPLEEGGPAPEMLRRTADADRYLRSGSFFSVAPAPGTLAREDGLLLENRFGAGRAYLFTYVPAAALLDGSDGNYRPAEVARAWEHVVATGAATARTVSSRAMAALEQGAIRILVWFSGFRYPPRGGVLLFILGYLAVGFFITGFYFYRRRRLERMYLVALAIAVAASIGIYRFGLLSGISEQGVDEVAVAAVRPGSAVADVAGFLGISSPSHQTLAPDLEETPLRDAVPSQPSGTSDDPMMMARFGPPRGRGEFIELLPLNYRIEGNSIRLPSIRLYPNATRYLRFDYPLDLGGPLAAAFRSESPGRRTLEISNGTRYSLQIYLVDGSGVLSEYGELGSGERNQFPVARGTQLNPPEPERMPYWARQIGEEVDRDNVSTTFRTALCRSLAARALGGGGDGGGGRRVSYPAYIVAEIEEPLFPTGALGPVRRSLGYLIAEVEETGESR